MRVLVTGHQGYIGPSMLQRLLEEGHELTGLDPGLFVDGQLEAGPAVPGIARDLRDVTEEDLAGFLKGGLFGKTDDIDTRHHHLTDVSFFEVSDGKDEFSFLGIEVGGKVGLIENFQDFFSNSRRCGCGFLTFGKKRLKHFH